jgi:tRNA-splicing ligase RtcB
MKVINTERLPIKLWLDDIEDGALQQARNLANLPFVYKWVAIMPDSHQGYGMPIGGVMATDSVIVPNAVGVDIGCGMIAVKTDLQGIETDTLKQVMGEIRKVVPVGFSHQEDEQLWSGFDNAPDIEIIQRELKSARKQLGTLGGGNHFIEIQHDEENNIWVMIHSGSRNFGLKTATEYHHKAQYLCQKWVSDIPDKDLSFLPIEMKEGKEYFEAMKFCLDFAQENRSLMMRNVLDVINSVTGALKKDEINIHHNYAAYEHHFGKNVIVHRKGATKANKGLLGIIPGSMGTTSYIVEGLGNPESFESCSHGAGRRMGRKEASRVLSLEEERQKMGDVIHGLRTAKDLDEAPGAYKDIDIVMENQKDLVNPIVKLRPLASIKG